MANGKALEILTCLAMVFMSCLDSFDVCDNFCHKLKYYYISLLMDMHALIWVSAKCIRRGSYLGGGAGGGGLWHSSQAEK